MALSYSQVPLADELSMHLLTTPLLYRILVFQASPQRTKIIGAVLLTLFTIVMVAHMVMDEFIIHAGAFGLSVYLIATRTLKIIPQQVPDPAIRGSLRRISFFGCCMFSFYLISPFPPRIYIRRELLTTIACFAFGYFVWLIDVWACGMLTQTRQTIGLPLAFLTELHGWYATALPSDIFVKPNANKAK